MIFTQLALNGAFLINIEPVEDERGFFARTFCKDEFKKHGIDFSCVQCNISYNRKKGTLRGMHYQAAPHEEAKIVSCIRGAIFDVIVDIRPQSETYKKWYGTELSAKNYAMLYLPKGFAHGFLTLCDNAEVQYMMSESYYPTYSTGFNYKDPQVQIEWPRIEPVIISHKDQSYKILDDIL